MDRWEALRRRPAVAGLELPWPVASAEPIGGHASTRRFYRLRPAAPARPASAVLVLYPPAEAEGVGRYLRAARWLAGAGVRVPRILATSTTALLVEDGGPELLAEAPREPCRRRRLYRQAVEAVVRIHRRRLRAPAPNPSWALDGARLRRELEFTERHALPSLPGSRRGARRRALDRLVEAIVDLPRTLCHRDFHARNLLVGGGRLMVLDFQDMMWGPVLYDLASLVWDNYCDVPVSVQAAVLHRYWLEVGPARLDPSPVAAVPAGPPGLPPGGRQAFALVALQRHLKALGTFGYQAAVLGRRAYLGFGPRTWSHARRALRSLGWEDLEPLLRPLAPLREPVSLSAALAEG